MGGGSGGHITPLIAVARELKQLQPDVKIIYIGQRGDGLADIPANHPDIDEVYSVRAGKWRRYHGLGWRQLLNLPTTLKNLRDIVYLIMGLIQSRKLLKRLQPEVIFIKGGFVGVPVGLSAASLHLKYVTHDSDAIPGLANRIIARWASIHAVALPKEVYAYPLDKTITVGVPVSHNFQPVTAALKKQYRQDLGISETAQLLFVIGGGLGAQRVNLAIVEMIPHLLQEFPDMRLVHVVGRTNLTTIGKQYANKLSASEQVRVTVKDYLADVYRYSGAADVIITRAGATNMAEFALQAKTCIVIPNPILASGHQLKNAQYLEDKHAAILVTEVEMQTNPNVLAARVSRLFKDSSLRSQLANNLASFGRPDSARILARELLKLLPKT